MPGEDTSSLEDLPIAAVADRVQELVDAAPFTPAYRSALSQALLLPGNILSGTSNARWARLVCVCCTVAGGAWTEAVTVAAAVELFMVALDLLDDVEDGEASPLESEFGPARTLNISTGLLLLAHSSLLDSAPGTKAARILSNAGLIACSGQHADLQTQADSPLHLDESLEITGQKSASLVSAICHLGALCGGADESRQVLYARFGTFLGMVLQIANDITGIHPGAQHKTDIALERPTLPVTYAKLISGARDGAVLPAELWRGSPAYLTWAVAEVYRRQALELIPQLTVAPAGHAALAKLVPVLA